MEHKSFVACIYLYQETAIASLNNKDVISEDPVELAKHYSNNNVDQLLIFDLSKTDEEHDKAIDIIKHICEVAEIPVMTAGNIKRFEDVKKLLYAGCAKAVLNYTKDSNIDITKECSERFGKGKLAVALTSADQYKENRDLIEDYTSELIVMKEDITTDLFQKAVLPMYIPLATDALDSLMEYLEKDIIAGVFGSIVNNNISEINGMKALCKERGIKTNGFDAKVTWSELKLNSDGLIPCIVQDYKTNEVLMMAYMNEEAFEATIRTGRMNYYSRSRNKQWLKGEESGHFQYVKSLYTDCDNDTLLAKVSQIGVACHTGARSCFFNEIVKRDYIDTDPLKVLENVYNVIQDRKVNPKEGSYTNYLFDKGLDKILKKLGEEATEIVIAAKNPNPEEVKYEISDFLYHMMVLMAEKNVTWEQILAELSRR